MTRGKGGRELSSKGNRGMAKCHESPECKVRRRAESDGSGDFGQQGSGEMSRGLIAFAAPHGLWQDPDGLVLGAASFWR
jgi:hypothetical protein